MEDARVAPRDSPPGAGEKREIGNTLLPSMVRLPREGAGTKGGGEKVGKKGSHVTGAGEPEGHGACGPDVAVPEVRVVCV